MDKTLYPTPQGIAAVLRKTGISAGKTSRSMVRGMPNVERVGYKVEGHKGYDSMGRTIQGNVYKYIRVHWLDRWAWTQEDRERQETRRDAALTRLHAALEEAGYNAKLAGDEIFVRPTT